jgi:hypothetical protein
LFDLMLRRTLSLLLALACFAALIAAARDLGRSFSFNRHGVTVEVDALGDLYRRGGRASAQGVDSHVRTAAVSFTTADGEGVTIRRGIPGAVRQALGRGEVLRIRYLPTRPQDTRFEGESSQAGLLLVLALVCAAAAYLVATRPDQGAATRALVG